MNQETFEARHSAVWEQFERWLDAPAARRAGGNEQQAEAIGGRVPRIYRMLCQHLALARDRQYSPGLVERLNRLVMRGHQRLYGAHPESGPAVARFFGRGFAEAVRRQYRVVALAAILFFAPLVALVVALQHYPDFVYTILPPGQVAAYEEMYDPANLKPGTRGAQADTFMLGHYIWNNVRIGFQTFAGGLLFGCGTVFFLVFNGLMIGTTAGHLIQIGYAGSFLTFVAGHSAFELTGIVLMGAAGLKLGIAVVAPGSRTRADALRLNARAAVPLVYGAGALLTVAALIEAFWSPIRFAPTIKYAVGCGLWIGLIAYFLFAGRNSRAS
jgi:uncharacterized membrane protein SpoIIM required for sporulation